MKILLCDYKVDLDRNYDYEIQLLKRAIPDVEVLTYEYADERKSEFLKVIADVDSVINTYVPFTRDVFAVCRKLKCICLNSMGYNTVDIQAATEKGVMVCAIEEYCTDEVAEHALALILALERGIKPFSLSIDNRIWDYKSAGKLHRVAGQVISIFGFGKIGKAVAKRCQALGMKVQVVSASLSDDDAGRYGVAKVEYETALRTSDVISNHLAMNEKNADYFDYAKFALASEKTPIFINTGRGGTVKMDDLVRAIDEGLLSGAGIDVLATEDVDFDDMPLLGRSNVLITPHAAFYSEESALLLQQLVCKNTVCCLQGNYGDVKKIVNKKELGL